jgi:tetraacyldisaccharide 4'-kinase
MKRWLHGWLLRRWYGKRPIWVLIPLSWLFIVLTSFRRALYRSGILLPDVLPVPVIVVGNISVGGSGKTPCTLWLAERFAAAGYRPGIITRGYGGHARSWPRLVSAESKAHEVGDEAVLLARRSGLPVAAGPDRVAAARLLVEKQRVDLILSDDGLQHYRLPRAAEVIMLDGTRGLGNGWRLPAGPLRESARRLRAAQFVVVKAGAGVPANIPTGACQMTLELGEPVSLADGSRRVLREFAGRRVHAAAAIADPEQFFDALNAGGLQVDGRALPDHADLSEPDLAFGDDLPVFVTEKDAVKCAHLKMENVWFVPATARFDVGDEMRILSGLQQCLTRPSG